MSKNQINQKEEILKEIQQSIKNEQKLKKQQILISIIFASIILIITLFILNYFVSIVKVTSENMKIEEVSMTKETSLKKMPIDKEGYYITYKLEILQDTIINNNQWNLFYLTIPKELKTFDLKNNKYYIYGMLDKDEAFLIRNKLEENNIIRRGTIDIKKPVIGWR